MSFALLISGCSASGPPFSPAPPGESSKAILYVYRPKAFAQSAASFDTFVDGIKIVELKNEGYTWIYVPAGEHKVLMQLGMGGPKIATKFTAEAGKNHYVKVGSTWSTAVIVTSTKTKIGVVEEKDALPEIRLTKYQPAIEQKLQ